MYYSVQCKKKLNIVSLLAVHPCRVPATVRRVVDAEGWGRRRRRVVPGRLQRRVPGDGLAQHVRVRGRAARRRRPLEGPARGVHHVLVPGERNNLNHELN